MNTLWPLINLLASAQLVACRDFYLGMFRRNDFLVAQDVIYKAPSPYGYSTASYGRLFKCPITYFRVVDRLGMGRGPFTTIVRGGLKKKYISVRIKSTYRLPVSVNIYVGCENKQPSTFRSVPRVKLTTQKPTESTISKNEPEPELTDTDSDKNTEESNTDPINEKKSNGITADPLSDNTGTGTETSTDTDSEPTTSETETEPAAETDSESNTTEIETTTDPTNEN